MKFALTTEQVDLQQTLSAYLAERAPLSQSSRSAGSGDEFDVDTWMQMARDLGLQGADAAEEHGGVGLTAVELSLVFQQAGRELYSGPLLTSTGLSLGLLLAAPASDVADALIADVCAGRVLASAISDDGGAWSTAGVKTDAEPTGDGWLLSGTKSLVLQADLADALLVAANTADGSTTLFLVQAGDAVVSVEPSVDPTRSVCTAVLDHVPAEKVTDVSDQILIRACLRASLAIASESLGAASRILQIASEYVTTRQQFGRPVGSFQGVKHRLADVLVDVELATSAVYLAACHLSDADYELARASVPMARVAADSALARAAAAGVQAHGGIGFTWENVAHFFVKRARANRELFGGPTKSRTEIWDHGHQLAQTD